MGLTEWEIREADKVGRLCTETGSMDTRVKSG